MTDWRKIGEQVYEYQRAFYWARLLDDEKARSNPLTTKQAFSRALVRCAQGDTAPIEDLLLSEHDLSLTREDRKFIAAILNRKYWVRRPGRRPEGGARLTCMIALRIFSSWRETNKKEGISDWGVRDKMKDQACHYALDIYRARPGAIEPNFETVRQLMDRPASRRGGRKSRRKAPPVSA
jgi:hypothetical protein